VIKDEINERASELHKFSKIGPQIIFRWFYLIIKKIIKNNEIEEYFFKFHLIESSLYVMILFPTILLCFLIIGRYNWLFAMIFLLTFLILYLTIARHNVDEPNPASKNFSTS
jgi:Ca2+/Na+ antiporter